MNQEKLPDAVVQKASMRDIIHFVVVAMADRDEELAEQMMLELQRREYALIPPAQA